MVVCVVVVVEVVGVVIVDDLMVENDVICFVGLFENVLLRWVCLFGFVLV